MWLTYACTYSRTLRNKLSKVPLVTLYSMCILKLSQKHLAAVIVGFCFIFLGEPLASIIAVCGLAYFIPLRRFGEAKIEYAVKFLDQKISKIPGKRINYYD